MYTDSYIYNTNKPAAFEMVLLQPHMNIYRVVIFVLYPFTTIRTNRSAEPITFSPPTGVCTRAT